MPIERPVTVLDLLLAPVSIGLPASPCPPAGAGWEQEMGLALGDEQARGVRGAWEGSRVQRILRHDWRRTPVDLSGYADSGLPAHTMGRSLGEDPLFFAAALAGGCTLAELMSEAAPTGGYGGDGGHRREQDER